MNAWQEKGRKAQRYMSADVVPQELKRGDVLTGWNFGPVGVVESEAVPHPTEAGWWLVDVASPYGVGTRVFGVEMRATVGRVPLKNVNPNGYLLATWQAPCGCVVTNGQHCEECGPYNSASPLYVNKGQRR
jgi:hypothetical protein